MKITKSELREIIKEEVSRLNENLTGFKEMKFNDLSDDDKKLVRTISNIIGHGADSVLEHNDGDLAIAFINSTVRLNKQAMQKLSALSKEIVIQRGRTYVICE
jgi:hypothetical protein